MSFDWFWALMDVAFTPPWIFVVWAVVIGGELYWLVVRRARREARKRRAELLVKFLKEIFEPMLYEELKNMRLEGSCFTLGTSPRRVDILYKMFEELGGIKALSPERVRWLERTILDHLAYKFDLDIEYIEHAGKVSVRFSRPIRED